MLLNHLLEMGNTKQTLNGRLSPTCVLFGAGGAALFYLRLLLFGSRGVGLGRRALLHSRRGQGPLLEQLPLPQQAGLHGSAPRPRKRQRNHN